MVSDVKERKQPAGPDPVISGNAGTGPVNEATKCAGRTTDSSKNGETRDHDATGSGSRKKRAPKLVQRVTALRGHSVVQVQPRRPVRSHTERDLLAEKFDLPYPALEKALRNIICSLIERQDIATENLLLKIDDLQYRIEDLEFMLEDYVTDAEKEGVK